MPPHGPLRPPPPPRRQPKPWEVEDLDSLATLEHELDEWTLRERFPLKPGQQHVEKPFERPLGMRYGEDAEPIGEQLGSRVIGLLASHVDSSRRLDSLNRCLRSVEAQTHKPARFFISTSSADAGLSCQAADLVQSSRCVDEHHDQGPQALPQFEHYRRLRDIIREREECLEDVWVFFSDDDDLWHPGRTAAYIAAAETVRRRIQSKVQAVCSCVHLRPGCSGLAVATPADVDRLMDRMVVGPHVHGSEHVDLCVRFSAFSAFFEEHHTRVLRHLLADVRFGYFVRHYGELPRKFSEESRHSEVAEEDVTEPERTTGPIKVFLPRARVGEGGPNWMYFYDKAKDTEVQGDGTGARVQVLRPDDEWYAEDLVGASAHDTAASASPQAWPAPELLRACASVRQRLDYGLLRLPRCRLVALESEVLALAASGASSRHGRQLAERFGGEAVEAWARSVCFSRCKAFRVEVYLSDFCAACGRETSLRCAQCKIEKYCSEDCQWDAWHKGHKEVCQRSAQQKADVLDSGYESVD